MSCKTGFKPDKYFIVQWWYETGSMSRVYFPERTLESLLTVQGKPGYKIVNKTSSGQWVIIYHWNNNNNQWKMDKNYAKIGTD